MVDITIYGAGIFGLSLAFSAARQGAKVRVIDPYGVGAGASGGVVGALAPHAPEKWNEKKAFQLESLLMAEPYWQDVTRVGGLESGYIRSGRVQTIASPHALSLAQGRAQSAKEVWGECAKWSVVSEHSEIGSRWSLSHHGNHLIYDDLSALINPLKAAMALAAAIRALGGEIESEGEALGHIVWATGWSAFEQMNKHHTRSVGGGMKGQAAVLAYDARSRPQVFSDGVHVIPHCDGTVAIGSTSESVFSDPDQVDEQVDALLDKALCILPELLGAKVLSRWAGVRPRSRSRAPMLGPHPFNAQQFVMNGGFKIGFGMAPLSGEVMADLILNEVERIPASFHPDRSL